MLAQKVTLGALCHNFSISCWGFQLHHWTASSLGTNHSPRFATQPVCLSLAMDPKWNARGKLIFKHLQNMTHPTLGVFLGPPGKCLECPKPLWSSNCNSPQIQRISDEIWWRYWVPQTTLKGVLQMPFGALTITLLSFAFRSFHVPSKVMQLALRIGQGSECSKWLSIISYQSNRLHQKLSCRPQHQSYSKQKAHIPELS